MTGRSEQMYWHSNSAWFTFNEQTRAFELTPEAPERAIRSFELWRKTKRR